jgi:hypothetical protein
LHVTAVIVDVTIGTPDTATTCGAVKVKTQS